MRHAAGLPESVRRKAEALLAGEAEIAPLQDAATVALVRDGEQGLEVFLQRRPATMAFAAGMVVFPGGRVEEQDTDPDLPWVGEPPVDIPFDYGRDIILDVARTADPGEVYRWLIAAAVRETLEEAGVLLATPVSDWPDDDRIETARQELHEGRQLAAVLADLRVALDYGSLQAYAHWMTPAVEPRRYDTRFFIAALPQGQQPRSASAESEEAFWIRPADALGRLREGGVAMLPPTVAALSALGAEDGVAVALAAGHRSGLRPILPHPFADEGEIEWRLIDGYTGQLLAEA